MQDNLDDIGFLEVYVKTASGAFPIENAQVTIYEYQADDKNNPSKGNLVYSLLTDENGRTPKVALRTKNKALSTSPGNENPYSVYQVGVSREGFYNNKYINVPIFQGVTSLQPVELIPLLEYASPMDDYPYTEQRFSQTPNTKL